MKLMRSFDFNLRLFTLTVKQVKASKEPEPDLLKFTTSVKHRSFVFRYQIALFYSSLLSRLEHCLHRANRKNTVNQIH